MNLNRSSDAIRYNTVQGNIEEARIYNPDFIRLADQLMPHLDLGSGFETTPFQIDCQKGTDLWLRNNRCWVSLRRRDCSAYTYYDVTIRDSVPGGYDTELQKVGMNKYNRSWAELPTIYIYAGGKPEYAGQNAPLDLVFPWFYVLFWRPMITSKIWYEPTYSKIDKLTKVRWEQGNPGNDGSTFRGVKLMYLHEIGAVALASHLDPHWTKETSYDRYESTINGKPHINFFKII